MAATESSRITPVRIKRGHAMEYGIGAAAGLVLGVAIGWLLASSKAEPEPAKPVEPPKLPRPSGAALRMLAILQAEARLVDFLLEDIQAASDQQIGQAVREVHKKAQA